MTHTTRTRQGGMTRGAWRGWGAAARPSAIVHSVHIDLEATMSESSMETLDMSEFMKVISMMSGSAGSVCVPRPFLAITGDAELAMVLSQSIHWYISSDGGFASHPPSDWESALCLSWDRILCSMNRLSDMCFLDIQYHVSGSDSVSSVSFRPRVSFILRRIVDTSVSCVASKDFSSNRVILPDSHVVASKSSRKRVSSSRPSLDEAISYFESMGHCSRDAEMFYDHFEANGWKMRSGSIRDWKAAARNWMRRSEEFSSYRRDKDKDAERRPAGTIQDMAALAQRQLSWNNDIIKDG